MKQGVLHFLGSIHLRKKFYELYLCFLKKGSIRGVARATGHDKDTTCRWIEIAGTHSKEVTAYFLRDLDLKRVEVDEIWSYIKKAKKVTEEYSDDYGDVYSLTAIKVTQDFSFFIMKENVVQKIL